MVLTHQTLGSNAIFFRNRGGWQNMSYIQLSMVVEGAGKMYVPNRGEGLVRYSIDIKWCH